MAMGEMLKGLTVSPSYLESIKDVVIKTGPTTPFTTNGWKRRREIAEGELRDSLAVPDASQVAVNKILYVPPNHSRRTERRR